MMGRDAGNEKFDAIDVIMKNNLAICDGKQITPQAGAGLMNSSLSNFEKVLSETTNVNEGLTNVSRTDFELQCSSGQARAGGDSEAANSALLVITPYKDDHRQLPLVEQNLPTPASHLAISDQGRWQLPPVEQTLPLAELVHQALVWLAARGKRIDCPELTGHERNGQPLQRPHTHAYILPLDLNEDRRIDHIFIHAPMGFSDQTTRAIRTLKVLQWRKTSKPFSRSHTGNPSVDGPVEIGTDEACNGARVFLQSAAASSLTPLSRALTQQAPKPMLPFTIPVRLAKLWHQANRHRSVRQDHDLGELVFQSLTGRDGAVCWESITPMVPPRFLKKSGRNDLLGQVQAELESRGLPKAATIEILESQSRDMQHFMRRRVLGGRRPPQDRGYALRLMFDRPVQGPIALGYASHFGLGLFQAVDTMCETCRKTAKLR